MGNVVKSNGELGTAVKACNEAIAQLRQERSGWCRELADTLGVAVRLAALDAPSALNKLRIFGESVSKKTCVHLGVSFPRTKPPGLFALTKLLKGRAPPEMIEALEKLRPPANAGSHHTPKSKAPGEAELVQGLILAATIANAFVAVTSGGQRGRNAAVATMSKPPRKSVTPAPRASANHTADDVWPVANTSSKSKDRTAAPEPSPALRQKVTFVFLQAPMRPYPVAPQPTLKRARKPLQ